MKMISLTLRTTIILIISTTVIVTSFSLWLLFERSHRAIYTQSMDSMGEVLRLITYDAKWRILLQDEYKESLLKYFSEEIWGQGEDILWVSIHEKDQTQALFRMKKPEYRNMEVDVSFQNMLAKFSALEVKPSYISDDIDEKQLRVFFYPVYGPVLDAPAQVNKQVEGLAPENLLFGEKGADEGDIIGYVLIAISASRIVQSLNQTLWKDIYITLTVILVGILIAFLVTRFLTGNITQLVRATSRITEGDFDHKVKIRSAYKELEELQDAFNSMTEEIREVDRLKETFLVNMSHELRAPLHSIIGLSGSLSKADKEYSEAQYKKGLSIINAEGNQLLNQINPILNLAKARAGKMEVQNEDIDVTVLLEEAGSAMQGMILSLAKSITFASELLTTDLVIKSDREKLKNILHNLLSNAVKFTEKGRIELSAWSEGEFVVFKVKDTGIGIGKKDKLRVFKRFQQIDHSLVRKEGGLGIGMSLSKEYVELLGGEIWLESEVGLGSSFYFKIPKNGYEFDLNAKRNKTTRPRFFTRLSLSRRRYGSL